MTAEKVELAEEIDKLQMSCKKLETALENKDREISRLQAELDREVLALSMI